MIEPKHNPEVIAQRIKFTTQYGILASERDAARARCADLETQLRIVTNERDEARALGRLA